MSRFYRLASGLPVSAAVEQIADHPELWDVDAERTTITGTPFRDTSDIWLRSLNRAEMKRDPKQLAAPHVAEAWPAWSVLTELQPLVREAIRLVRPWQVGLVLLTRVPPGVVIREHQDLGWHPEFYNAKAHIALQSNAGCVNTCEGDAASFTAGEAWTFDNTLPHSVRNDGETDRLTLIVCMRAE